MPLFRVATFVTLLTISVGAQEARSGSLTRAFGTARLSDGTPWQQATIVLLENTDLDRGWDIESGELDRRTATTDERGRFAFDVLAGRTYTGWASHGAGDGKVLFSKIRTEIHPGGRIEFVADAEPRTSRRVQLDTAQFGDAARLSLHIYGWQSGETTPLELGADGWVTFPPRAAETCFLTFRDADGTWIGGYHLAPDATPKTIHVPARATLRVRVVGSADKTPVKGARIAMVESGHRFELGVTDDAGEAVVTVPVRATADDDPREPQPGPILACVFADGYDIGALQIDPSGAAAQPNLAKDCDGICGLTSSEHGETRIALRNRGKPLVGVRALVDATASHQIDESSSMSMGMVLQQRSDAEGRITIPPQSGSGDLFAVRLRVDATLRAALGDEACARLPSWVPLWMKRGDEPGKAIELDLATDLVAAELVLLAAADQAPARNVKVSLCAASGQTGTGMFTDHVGRIRVLLAKSGPTVVLSALGAEGWCAVVLDPRGFATDPSRAAEQVQMRRSITIDVHVGVPEGKKVDQVWSYINVENVLEAAVEMQVGKEEKILPVSWIADALAPAQLSILSQGGSAVLDQDHRIQIHVAALRCRYRLNIGALIDGQWTNANEEIQVEGKEERLPLKVELGN